MTTFRPHALAIVLLLATGSVEAQVTVYAYPLADQSAEQQQRDDLECQRWAQARTGFDPRMRPPQVSANYAPPPPQSAYFGGGAVGAGGVIRDAAGGAALGAIGGAIAGDAGQGAAIGAASGALFGTMRRASRQRQEQEWHAQQQAQAAQQQQMLNQRFEQARSEFSRAYGSCMAARRYEVR